MVCLVDALCSAGTVLSDKDFVSTQAPKECQNASLFALRGGFGIVAATGLAFASELKDLTRCTFLLGEIETGQSFCALRPRGTFTTTQRPPNLWPQSSGLDTGERVVLLCNGWTDALFELLVTTMDLHGPPKPPRQQGRP